MTRILAILLLTAVLLQSFSKVIIYVNYEINIDYITRTFCVNKANPSKHCDGKCHLAKQLQDEEKQESLPANNQKENVEIQLFSQDENDFRFNSYVDERYDYPTINVLKPKSTSSPIFHPPMDIIRTSKSIV